MCTATVIYVELTDCYQVCHFMAQNQLRIQEFALGSAMARALRKPTGI